MLDAIGLAEGGGQSGIREGNPTPPYSFGPDEGEK